VLVNNAGMANITAFDQLSEAMWGKEISINLTGPFLGVQAAVPALRRSSRGAIVNISSVSGIVGTPPAAAYAASKGGLRALTKELAMELAPDNIRVNSVHPGAIETDMLLRAWEKDPDIKVRLEQATPLRRIGRPADIAYIVTFLASDESQFITGAEFIVDGGMTAQ
jgi:3alpha(or 20beta)-hydroxysteroid dehydrogenase/cyclopentanol dehydrogenase